MLILQGVPPLGSVKQGWCEKNKLFLRKIRQYHENAGDMPKVTIND